MGGAAPAVQAVFRLDAVGASFQDAALGTALGTGAAADAAVGDDVALGADGPLSHGVAFPEDGVFAQIEVLDGRVPDAEYDADVPGFTGVHVGQVGLFLKDGSNPFFLFRFGNGDGPAGQADHLLKFGQGQDLDPAVGQKLFTEILAPGRKEVQCVIFVMDGADVAHLGSTAGIHSGKGQGADVLELF